MMIRYLGRVTDAPPESPGKWRFAFFLTLLVSFAWLYGSGAGKIDRPLDLSVPALTGFLMLQAAGDLLYRRAPAFARVLRVLSTIPYAAFLVLMAAQVHLWFFDRGPEWTFGYWLTLLVVTVFLLVMDFRSWSRRTRMEERESS